jgi:hypothetical protein
VKSIFFWIAVGTVVCLGLRHLFSIMSGWDRDGKLKPGQRLCHATSLLLLIGSSVIAVILRICIRRQEKSQRFSYLLYRQ